VQEFTAPLNTNYKIECWGASGGDSHIDSDQEIYNTSRYGGKGGYCAGKITLPYNISLYVYVGQSGGNIKGVISFNGGGAFFAPWNNHQSGGGATDVRLSDGGETWNDFHSLKSRIIVAAGGGGAHHYWEGCNGGNAGGLSGHDGLYSVDLVNGPNDPLSIATGATQTQGGIGGSGFSNGNNGTFGIGGNGNNTGKYGSGGGGGYYGGGGGSYAHNIVGSGAGGSSFISGYLGCDAIDESSTEDNIIHTGQPNHYSGYVFTNSVMIDGGSTMPSPSGGTETGHGGNGYAIISWISPSL